MAVLGQANPSATRPVDVWRPLDATVLEGTFLQIKRVWVSGIVSSSIGADQWSYDGVRMGFGWSSDGPSANLSKLPTERSGPLHTRLGALEVVSRWLNRKLAIMAEEPVASPWCLPVSNPNCHAAITHGNAARCYRRRDSQTRNRRRCAGSWSASGLRAGSPHGAHMEPT